MNTKRIMFWVGFVVVLALIVWGLVAAMNKSAAGPAGLVGDPAPVTDLDHIKGAANATVTLIEYSDFQCPACRSYAPIVDRVVASSSVPVRLVYRHYPLPQHANAPLAAQASEAASLQGKFWQMYQLLFTNQNAWASLSDPTSVFEGYAQNIGLDMAKFRTDLTSAAVKAKVASSLTDAQELGLFQTPSFFLNGKLIENPQSYEQFETAIKSAAR